MGILAKDFWTFKQYREAKKTAGLEAKPKVEKIPDYNGPQPTKPDGPVTRGKGWEIPVPPAKTPAPYKGGGSNAPAQKMEKGLGDKGDQSLKYKPNEGSTKKVKTWPTTESFLDKTKDMSLSDFAKHVRKGMVETRNKDIPHVVAYEAGPYHPDPIQAVKYVTFLASENENIMRALLREAQRLNCIDSLVAELLHMPESYTEIASQMSADPSVSRSIVRAMSDLDEQVGPPMHKDDSEEIPTPEDDAPPTDDDADISLDPEGDDAPPEEGDVPPDDEGMPADGFGDMPQNKPAHQNLADAIAKHRTMAKKMSSYMGKV